MRSLKKRKVGGSNFKVYTPKRWVGYLVFVMLVIQANERLETADTLEDKMFTPFENAQRWMGKNTIPILLLNDDDMIGEH